MDGRFFCDFKNRRIVNAKILAMSVAVEVFYWAKLIKFVQVRIDRSNRIDPSQARFEWASRRYPGPNELGAL
jgi:hypothetical protein